MSFRSGSRKRAAAGSSVLIGNFAFAPGVRVDEPASVRIKKYTRRSLSSRPTELYAVQSSVHSSVVQAGQRVPPSGGYSYAVAVRNRVTGEVEFADAALVHFAPKFTKDPKRFLGLKAEAKPAAPTPKPETTRKEQRRSLLARFGADKKKRAVEVAAAREAAGEQATSTVLMGLGSALDKSLRRAEEETSSNHSSSMLETSEIASTSTDASLAVVTRKTVSGRSQVLPSFNTKATSPAAVFSFSDFLSLEDLGGMWDHLQAFMSEKPLGLVKKGVKDIAIGYLLSGRELPGTPGQTEKEGSGTERRAAVLLWLDLLLRTSFLLSGRGKRVLWASDLDDICVQAGDHLRNKLTAEFDFHKDDNGRRTKKVGWNVTKLAKDQILATALAIALMLSPQSEVSLEPWSLVTGSQVKALSDVAGILGCVVTASGAGPHKRTTARLVGPPGNAIAEAKKAKKYSHSRRTL